MMDTWHQFQCARHPYPSVRDRTWQPGPGASRVQRRLQGRVRCGDIRPQSSPERQVAAATIQTFVRNRVAEIRKETGGFIFKYIRFKDNPADLISRGMFQAALMKCGKWWEGPGFLESVVYQEEPTIKIPDSELPELRTVKLVILLACNTIDFPIFEDCSSFRKLQRIMVYVMRFLIVKVVQHDVLSQEIQQVTENDTAGHLQGLTPFLHEGLLRVGGKLQHSELPFAAKHQLILSKHRVTNLIVKAYHEEHQHAGPSSLLAIRRRQFWLLDGRSTVRSDTKSCVTCFRAKQRSTSQLMGRLPSCCVTENLPFDEVGVNYAGTITVKVGTRKQQIVKAYFVVSVCMVTELVSDLTTETFLATLQRFVSRRGIPRQIHSDNVQGDHLVVHPSRRAELRWPLGGRCKEHLKRILKNRSLPSSSTRPCYRRSRPCLTQGCFSQRQPADPEVLTPGHFLIGRPLMAIPEPAYEGTPTNRLSK
ncbi:uncharacterized protein LOC120430138 [Culex pipiens pallens]|uniref:uncharacterized protein LOC120430138 n=1 Tax=Culex pipiens pallens TaxID=42434 RepID=UPI0019530786|nr:uncharacterized protein LOC120430138 [Culex pipiens pallens]